MPTTRAARRAAAERRLLELPADVLGLVLYQLPLAHDIAAVAPTCRLLCDAAKLALKLRPFSGEVVTLAGHTGVVPGVAAASDGRIITASHDRTVKVWRDGTCERTILAHSDWVRAVAVLPGGARFVSGADDDTAKLWTLDGTLERTFDMGSFARCVAALPDDLHFVVGTWKEVRLYHVDGTLVHTFTGHTNTVYAVAVTPDGQHIISGAGDHTVKVWSVATKSLVSTCEGHTNRVQAVAAMPDGQRILSADHDGAVCVWLLDGALKNTFQAARPQSCSARFGPSWRCPTTSTRSPPRLTRPSSSSTSTTAPSCAPSGTTQPRCTAWRCCPTAAASSAAWATPPARIVEHGLAPQPALK